MATRKKRRLAKSKQKHFTSSSLFVLHSWVDVHCEGEARHFPKYVILLLAQRLSAHFTATSTRDEARSRETEKILSAKCQASPSSGAGARRFVIFVTSSQTSRDVSANRTRNFTLAHAKPMRYKYTFAIFLSRKGDHTAPSSCSSVQFSTSNVGLEESIRNERQD